MQDIFTVQAATMPAVAPVSAFTPLQLMGLFLGSSVLAAILTGFLTWRRERKAEKADRRFAGLYLALALEDYGETLSGDIYDAHNAANEEAEEFRFLMGVVPPYPEVDWKALGIDRTVAALSFRVKVDRIRGQLTAEADFGDWEDVSYKAEVLAAELGLEAIALARSFRRKMSLPSRDTSGAEAHFKEVMKERDEREQREENRRLAREPVRTANPSTEEDLPI